MYRESSSGVETAIRERNASQVGAITAIICLISAVVYAAIGRWGSAWQLYALAGVALTVSAVAGGGVWLSRRGRPTLAMELMVGTILLSCLIAVTLISGLGLTLGSIAVTLTVVVASYTLSAARGTRAIAVAAVVGALFLLYDLYGPAGRMPVPEPLAVFLPVALAVFVLIIGVLIIRQFSRYSLLTKILITSLSLTLLSVGVLALLLERFAQASLTAEVADTLSHLASTRALVIGDHLHTQQDVLRALAMDGAIQDAVLAANESYPAGAAAARDEVERLDLAWQAAGDADPLIQSRLSHPAAADLHFYAQTFLNNENILVADRYGGVVAATYRPPVYDQSGEAWWQAGYDQGQGGLYFGRPELDEAAGDYRVLIAVPVRARTGGETLGVLRTSVSLASVVALLNGAILAEDRRVSLLLPNGVLLDGRLGLSRAEASFVQALEALPAGQLAEATVAGVPELISQAPVTPSSPQDAGRIQSLGWRVVALQDRASALAQVTSARRAIWLVGLAVVAVAALMAVALSRYVTDPVVRLTAVAEKISSGDLTARVQAETQDEIGTLARTLDVMTGRLQQTFETLEQRVAERTVELAAANLSLQTEIVVRRQSEEKFRGLVESGPDAFIIVDETGRINFVNSRIEDLFGYTPSDVVGCSVETLMPDRFRGRHAGHRTGYAADPRTRPMGVDQQLFGLRKDGSEFPIEISLSPLTTTGGLLTTATIRDMTERKRFESALRESEQLFRHLFAASPDAIVLIDPHHPAVSWPIVDCNDAACQMNGYTREALIGQSVDLLNITVGTPEERRAYLANLRREPVSHVETYHRHRDGHIFPIDVSTSLVTVGGRELVLGIDRDITERKHIEAALRESEERLRRLFTASPDAIFLLDPHAPHLTWPIVDCNDAACQMNGYTREELIGRSIDLLNTTIDTPEERAEYLARLRREGVTHLEVLHRHKDGHTFSIEIATSLVTVGGRELVLGIDRDITERKRIEAALRESEQRFRYLFDGSPEAIFLIDPHDPESKWPIVDCNEAAGQMNGYTREELIGQPIEVINTAPGSVQGHAQYLARLRREGVVQDEAVHRHRDGHIFPIEFSTSLVTVGGRELVLGIDRDITERKRIEAALRESEQRFRYLFDGSPDAIFLLDPHDPDVLWPIVDCNEAAGQMNGYTREELIGRSVDTFNLTAGSREGYAAHLALLRQQGVMHAVEAIHRHKAGHVFPIEYASTLITVGDRELVLSVDRDITKRKRAEEALKVSEERFQLVTYATNDALWDWDLQTGERWWNKGVRTLFGYAQDQVRGDQTWWEEQIHPEDRVKVLDSLQMALMSDGQFWSKEYRYRRADGTYAYVFDRGYVMQDERGEPIRIIGAMMDLTERKRTEEALRQSEELFSKAFHASPVPMAVTRMDNGVFVDVNNDWERLFGWERGEAIGRSLFDLKLYDDLEEREAVMQRIREQGFVRNHEVQYRIRSGEMRSVLLSAQVVDVRGQVCALRAFYDITERKRAEEALAQEQYLLNSLLDNVPDYIYFKDARSRFMRTSRAHARAFGLNDPAQVVGKTDFDFFTEEHARPAFEDEQEIIRTGQPISKEERETWPDRPDTWVMATKMPLRDRLGIIIGTFGISKDITERKQAEEALRELNDRLTHSVKELEQRNNEIEMLNKMGDNLQACSTLQEAYEVIAGHGHQLFGQDSGIIYMVSPSRDMVETAVTWGPGKPDELSDPVFAPHDCWAWRRARPHAAGAGIAAPLCRHYVRSASAAHLCVPLTTPDGQIGLLHLHHIPEAGQEPFGEARQRLAQAVSDTVSLALTNLNLRETLRNQSIRDPLTNLFNRRYMEESLERELQRATRRSYSIGIIMLDVDHFKRFNDTFGHAAGDLMLRDLGNFLTEHVRGGDVACRYGGEEFTIILPEASFEITCQRAEQLRQAAKSMHVHYHGQSLGDITISVGVAAFPNHGASGEALLRAADQALYRAKNTGRDRVVAAE